METDGFMEGRPEKERGNLRVPIVYRVSDRSLLGSTFGNGLSGPPLRKRLL